MNKLVVKLHGVEFRDKFTQYGRCVMINKLMEQLGIVCKVRSYT